jgi:hypothetical protein
VECAAVRGVGNVADVDVVGAEGEGYGAGAESAIGATAVARRVSLMVRNLVGGGSLAGEVCDMKWSGEIEAVGIK